MKQLGVNLTQDPQQGTIGYTVKVDNGWESVDPFGVETHKVTLSNFMVVSEETDTGFVARTILFLATEGPLPIEVNVGGIRVAQIAVSRVIQFDAASDDELIVSALAGLEQKKAMYAELRHTGNKSLGLIKAIRSLDRALCHELPDQFVSLASPDILTTIAESAKTLAKSHPSKLDNIQSLISTVLSNGRQVGIEVQSGVKTQLFQNSSNDSFSVFGRFVDVVGDTGNNLHLVLLDPTGERVYVPMSSVQEFKF